VKIIEQSHQLLPEQDDLIQQIGSRAAICYQSDGDNTEANIKRVQHCLKNGHMSALEMGRVTTLNLNHKYTSPYITQISYNNCRYASGSVRAWLEVGCDFDTILKMPKVEFPQFNTADYARFRYQAVKLITNRAISHQLVRHRVFSVLQESQRYVRYDKPGGIEFIKPLWANTEDSQDCWKTGMRASEILYGDLLNLKKLQPQQARSVLPNDTKTELIMYGSLAHWRHLFYMRCQGGADPMVKALMNPVLEEFKILYPSIFDELKPSVAGK